MADPSAPPLPNELKFIAPFLDRSRELKQRDPVIAYWCSYYAAKLALSKAAKSKDSQSFLVHLLDSLEEDKTALAGNEAVANDVVAYARIENFALKIFLNADNEDRQGVASKKTAKTFLASSIFLELLKTFGEVDPEVEEKIKYSKWKAMDIMKCLREGRTPVPGPPGGELTDAATAAGGDDAGILGGAGGSGEGGLIPGSTGALPGTTTIDIQQFPPAPTTPVAAQPTEGFPWPGSSDLPGSASGSVPHPGDARYANTQHPSQSPYHQGPPPHGHIPSVHPPPSAGGAPFSPQPPPRPSARPPSSSQHGYPGVTPTTARPSPKHINTSPASTSAASAAYGNQPIASPSVPPPVLDHTVVAAASKHARFVISALQYDDVKTAVDNLKAALQLLQPYNTEK